MSTSVNKEIHTPPNPGSDEAIKLGCTCPIYDNEHGDVEKVGYYLGESIFVIRLDCHLHNRKETDDTVYKCTSCGFMAIDIVDLLVHIKTEHEE